MPTTTRSLPAMERLTSALRRLDIDPDQFVEHVIDVLESSEPVPLPRSVAETVAASGGPSVERIRQLEKRIAAGELRSHRVETQLITDSVTMSGPQVARILGKDPSTIRHRVAKELLIAFGRGRGRRLATWQFDGTDTIPGVPQLAQAMRRDEHPLAVHNFMTSPNPNLMVGDEPVSPRDWLIDGGAVEPVVRMLAHRGQW